MNELKAHRFITTDELFPEANAGALYYDKSEADKMIAELEENHKKEVGQLLIEIAELKKEKEYTVEQTTDVINGQERELRHQMYKWCLAMAKWCFTKSNYHFVLARHGEDVKENNRKSILYSKWHRRWLAIAEKFKPNSTLNKKD